MVSAETLQPGPPGPGLVRLFVTRVESFNLKDSFCQARFFENTILARIPDEVSHLGCYKLQEEMMQSGIVEPPGPRIMSAGR